MFSRWWCDDDTSGHNAVWTCMQIQTFRRNIMPPSSGLRNAGINLQVHTVSLPRCPARTTKLPKQLQFWNASDYQCCQMTLMALRCCQENYVLGHNCTSWALCCNRQARSHGSGSRAQRQASERLSHRVQSHLCKTAPCHLATERGASVQSRYPDCQLTPVTDPRWYRKLLEVWGAGTPTRNTGFSAGGEN
jgi:hypothetical protein